MDSHDVTQATIRVISNTNSDHTQCKQIAVESGSESAK
jgi:hypothetical protein